MPAGSWLPGVADRSVLPTSGIDKPSKVVEDDSDEVLAEVDEEEGEA